MAIGITTTTISGVGSTDKLPNELFVVKIDDARLKFTDTAEKANKLVVTDTIELNSVGVGDSHVITSINQNAKALIKRLIIEFKLPVTGTAVTTTLDQDIVFDTIFDVTGITSFASRRHHQNW